MYKIECRFVDVYGSSEWFCFTEVATTKFYITEAEYRVLVNDVEVCRVQGSDIEGDVLYDYLLTHPTAVPMLACLN